MTEFKDLTEDQQKLFGKLEPAITSYATINRPSVADILKKYKPKNEDSKNEDIEAVFTASGCRKNFTLPAFAAFHGNHEALKDILSAASKIPGLNKKILTSIQFKYKKGKSEITRYTLPEYIYNRKPNMIAIIEERLKELGIPIPQKPQDQAAGADTLSATPQPSIEGKQNQAADPATSSATPQPSVEDKQNQDVGAGALNANEESNTKELKDLTKEQKKLFHELKDAIIKGIDVASILSGQDKEDIKEILTVSGRSISYCTLSAFAAEYTTDAKALKGILKAASKIPGLNKKILTDIQYEYVISKSETMLYTLPEYIYNHKPDMIAAIEESMKILGIPIPQKQQDQGAGALSSTPQTPIENVQDQAAGEGTSSATPQPSVEDKQNQAADPVTSSATPQPSVEGKQNQAAGAGALNAESDTKESNNLTPEQKQRMLSFDLDNAITLKKSVAGILKQYKSENEDSYAKDIETVLTVFSPLDMI